MVCWLVGQSNVNTFSFYPRLFLSFITNSLNSHITFYYLVLSPFIFTNYRKSSTPFIFNNWEKKLFLRLLRGLNLTQPKSNIKIHLLFEFKIRENIFYSICLNLQALRLDIIHFNPLASWSCNSRYTKCVPFLFNTAKPHLVFLSMTYLKH